MDHNDEGKNELHDHVFEEMDTDQLYLTGLLWRRLKFGRGS